LRRALSILEKVGEDNSLRAATLYNFGLLFRDQGNGVAAESMFWQALSLEEKVFGPKHLSCAETLENLASLHQARGDVKGAVPLFRQALAIKQQHCKPNDPELAKYMNNLGVVLGASGQRDEAEELLRRGLSILEKASSAVRDTALGAPLFNLAVILHKKGDYLEAESLYRRAIESCERSEEERSNRAFCMETLATLLEDKGDLSGARSLLESAYGVALDTIGADHPTAISIQTRLSSLVARATETVN
jgi:tetratricopeptide (TPR) repeat protein